MLLIVGLGNPGKKYEGTRHNAGFAVIEKLRERWDFPVFEFGKKFDASLSKGKFKEKEIILAKPETFMNLSGQAVKNLMDFYKLYSKDILVIHDDLDIPLGEFRVATDSGSAGHNGVENIIDLVGTKTFRRIRIGIRPEEGILDATNFVLQKFSQDEMKMLNGLSENMMEAIEKII